MKLMKAIHATIQKAISNDFFFTGLIFVIGAVVFILELIF